MRSSSGNSILRGHRRICPEEHHQLSRPLVLGAILAGGASRRFEGDKASVIGPRVVAAMQRAGIDPIVAIGGTPGILAIPTIADRFPGEGPLAGVATALSYARSGWVLTATCDLPLLSSATLTRLVDGLDGLASETAAVAAVDGRLEPSLACWPAAWAGAVNRAVRSGERRFGHLLSLGSIEAIEVDARSLLDADDRSTLSALLADEGLDTDADMPDEPHTEA